MSARSGIGYDSHRFAEGRPLVLGGVEIPGAERGLAGHSDADVLAHAAIDALLGAAGLGDIGLHFPDTDERWRDADSIDLLEEVCRFISEHGWTVRHLDATVICEAPKLGPHRDAMRATPGGRHRRSPPLEVNVKFTTNEGMGFVGRGEGIARAGGGDARARSADRLAVDATNSPSPGSPARPSWSASGEVSSRELVELYLERIERLDPKLNAFRVVYGRARARSRRPGRRAPRGGRDAAAARRADRGQGQHRPGRRGDHARHRRLRAAGRARLRADPAACARRAR